MGAEKRGRDRLHEAGNNAAADALLGLGYNVKPAKKLKVCQSNASSLAGLMPLQQRTAIFNIANSLAVQALNKLVSCTLAAGGSGGAGVSIVLNQVASLQSLFSIIAVEIGQMCSVVVVPSEIVYPRIASVLVSEFKRLGSVKCAFALLRLLVSEVDSVLQSSGVFGLLGSVEQRLSSTFKQVQSLIVHNRQSKKKQIESVQLTKTNEKELKNQNAILSKFLLQSIDFEKLSSTINFLQLQNNLQSKSTMEVLAKKTPSAIDLLTQTVSISA
mmetsp:Transcript_13575/g.16453  ORF Transcript_13575/g.16453 Transcript_13575/m.16453 type:complete len:272 (-) Transcript_13575:105-920(-)